MFRGKIIGIFLKECHVIDILEIWVSIERFLESHIRFESTMDALARNAYHGTRCHIVHWWYRRGIALVACVFPGENRVDMTTVTGNATVYKGFPPGHRLGVQVKSCIHGIEATNYHVCSFVHVWV